MDRKTNFELKIGWLYPALMSTYGDRGNVIALRQRSYWRGIQTEVVRLGERASVRDFRGVDMLVGGGAQDREQEIVMRDLRGLKADALAERIQAGTPGVFTCGSLQLLGHYYEPTHGQRIEGLHRLHLWTVHPGPGARRCIGNLAFELTAKELVSQLPGDARTLLAVGFENHGGRTYLGNEEPLGRVRRGYGNNGQDGTEGAFHKHIMATYSHGPLLPKNPFLADWMIGVALRQKYGAEVGLPAVDDTFAQQARSSIFDRLGVKSRGPEPVRHH